MIIDTLNNASKYTSLNPLFAKAFDFINQNDVATLENIDIQVCLKGLETIAWKPREKCVTPNGDYNPEKDVRFFNDAPDMYFQLTDGQFGIFYPEDVHAPMIGAGEHKKL